MNEKIYKKYRKNQLNKKKVFKKYIYIKNLIKKSQIFFFNQTFSKGKNNNKNKNLENVRKNILFF